MLTLRSMRGVACIRRQLASVAPLVLAQLPCAAQRLLHTALCARNSINLSSPVRTAHPTRTEQMMNKRMTDRAHEEAAARMPHVFASDAAFLQQVQQSYARLERGLADMLAVNSGMALIRTPDAASSAGSSSADPPALEVALGEGKGSFTLHADPSAQRLILFTPASAAVYKYRWDAGEGRWVADCDGHAMEELFVRDIISAGLLSFPQL